MFWSMCCLSRSPPGRLATASSLAGMCLDTESGPRGSSVLGESLMGQDLSQIYERYH